MPGRNDDCQFCDSINGIPPGHMQTNPGRFWFSVPRPYVTHEPRLGRTVRLSPVFINKNDGSWLGTSACIDRITQMSSMCFAVCSKISLTSMPDLPYFLNLKGDGNAAPVLRSVLRLVVGSGLPAYFCKSGLGSKVSTWDGPPLANRGITRFALAGKCGLRGASGLAGSTAPFAAAVRSPASPR